MITLRDLRPDDEAQLLTWRNLPEVARYMYSEHAITPEEHAAWFAGIAGDARRQYWVITLDGEDVGLANLYDLQPTHRRCAWAFYLASPNVRGRGVGTMVEYSVLQHVFETRGLEKLCCEVLAFNEAVVAMHERFGFTREGLYRRHILKGGEWHDVVALALLADEWRAGRNAIEARLRERGLL